jgi:hypothetical protein
MNSLSLSLLDFYLRHLEIHLTLMFLQFYSQNTKLRLQSQLNKIQIQFEYRLNGYYIDINYSDRAHYPFLTIW